MMAVTETVVIVLTTGSCQQAECLKEMGSEEIKVGSEKIVAKTDRPRDAVF